MKKRPAKTALIVLGVLIAIQTQAQKIEIGQNAQQIQNLIEWTTKDHNKTDSYGNRASSYWSWDIKYNNGKIADIIQCYQKQYLVDLGIAADYCKHYIIDNNNLAYVITQFENVSIEKLEDNYSNNSSNTKIADLYFADDYEHYSKIYLSKDGIATIEWRKTIISELPANIQKTVNQKLTAQRTETENQQETEAKAKQTEEENDMKERESTILSCEDFQEGLALISIDAEYNAGQTNYGYGKQLFGFINDKGKVVIHPKYQEAFSFSNGFALVTSNAKYSGSWEFINKKGENVFNKTFVKANSFSEGLAAIRFANGLYNFIDTTGNLLSDIQYEKVGDFKEGFAKVKLQDKWGFINKAGKEVIIPQFTDVHDFSEGLALVIQSINYYTTAYSYIDSSGKIAIKLSERDAPVLSQENSHYVTIRTDDKEDKEDESESSFCDFHNGLAMIKIDRTQGSFGFSGVVFIDKAGKTLIKPKDTYESIHPYSEGFALAMKYAGQKYGFLNDKGQWAVKPVFDDAGSFHEGLAKVQIDANWGFVDSTGNVAINKDIMKSKTEVQTNSPYDAASNFSDGFAIVKTRQKFGYIDKSGTWVIKPMLIAAMPFKNGMARVKFADRKGWNFIDKTGKVLFNNFL